jgi:EamA domain-containing membrane protein RarD
MPIFIPNAAFLFSCSHFWVYFTLLPLIFPLSSFSFLIFPFFLSPHSYFFALITSATPRWMDGEGKFPIYTHRTYFGTNTILPLPPFIVSANLFPYRGIQVFCYLSRTLLVSFSSR